GRRRNPSRRRQTSKRRKFEETPLLGRGGESQPISLTQSPRNKSGFPCLRIEEHMSIATMPDVISDSLPEELDRIFREHYQMVYRTAYGVTGRGEDAEDILQTLFLHLLRRGSPPDLMRNPKAYLYRAAVNLSLNTIRQRQRDVLTGEMEHFEAAVQD